MSYTIPVTIVDDFFDDPIMIREYALQQNFFPDSDGKWPGERTKLINDKNFVCYTINKFLSLFYDKTLHKWEYSVDMAFQKVDESYGEGWIHSDNPKLITGIIYLNPDKNINSGTTLYTPKNVGVKVINEDDKRKSYLNNKKNEEKRIENNSQFDESIIIKNKFNRLLAFDSFLFHSANNFFGNGNSSRLTLVFFIHNLIVNDYPIYRLKRSNA